jgi:hypothetical protein
MQKGGGLFYKRLSGVGILVSSKEIALNLDEFGVYVSVYWSERQDSRTSLLVLAASPAMINKRCYTLSPMKNHHSSPVFFLTQSVNFEFTLPFTKSIHPI